MVLRIENHIINGSHGVPENTLISASQEEVGGVDSRTGDGTGASELLALPDGRPPPPLPG